MDRLSRGHARPVQWLTFPDILRGSPAQNRLRAGPLATSSHDISLPMAKKQHDVKKRVMLPFWILQHCPPPNLVKKTKKNDANFVKYAEGTGWLSFRSDDADSWHNPQWKPHSQITSAQNTDFTDEHLREKKNINNQTSTPKLGYIIDKVYSRTHLPNITFMNESDSQLAYNQSRSRNENLDGQRKKLPAKKVQVGVAIEKWEQALNSIDSTGQWFLKCCIPQMDHSEMTFGTSARQIPEP
jgi:hypothetical protein